jgi:hypothetical protein
MAGPTLAWVWAACRKHSLQPITASWLGQVLNISEDLARAYISRLKRYGCLRRDDQHDGLGVRYAVDLTKTLPLDARGQHWERKRAAALLKPSRDHRDHAGAMRKRKRQQRKPKLKPCEPG